MFNSSFSDKNFEDVLREGILAAKGGSRKLAHRLLNQAAQMKHSDARPWLWLAETTEDLDERRKFLGYAVAAEPGNAAARRALVALSKQSEGEELLPEGAGVEPRRPLEPEDASTKRFVCPQCGGHLSFDTAQEHLACLYCGFRTGVVANEDADKAETAIDFVLPTARGHRWAETQQRVACEGCGAVALLAPGAKAGQCNFCGSNRLIQMPEAGELVDPQVIGIMKLDAQRAAAAVKKWLGQGWFRPDDLVGSGKNLHLRPAYYPFWTFDGALTLNWSCQIHQDGHSNANWVYRSGQEVEFFDDVLVPGLKALSETEISRLEPFSLKEVVEFQPEHLAGWNALVYDRSLADASLIAREKVVKRVRASLESRVEPGSEKRGLTTSSGSWSGITFKHVLLPLWVGAYRYQGKAYRVLVNGQTGKVTGERPKDQLKVVMFFLAALITIVVLGLAALLLLG